MARHIDTAECAKLIRQSLKVAFPLTKFSVRLSRYAGGSSIDVKWIDGPSVAEVNRIAGKYKGADFDGSIDLKTYHDGELNGERVHFGADFVQCQRQYSVPFMKRRAESVARRYGVSVCEVENSYFGAKVVDNGERVGRDFTCWLVMRAADKTSVKVGE